MSDWTIDWKLSDEAVTRLTATSGADTPSESPLEAGLRAGERWASTTATLRQLEMLESEYRSTFLSKLIESAPFQTGFLMGAIAILKAYRGTP
jgi:hypothetical protein